MAEHFPTNLAVDAFENEVGREVDDAGLLSDEDEHLLAGLEAFQKLEEDCFLLDFGVAVVAVNEDHFLSDAVNRRLQRHVQEKNIYTGNKS